MQVIVSTGKLGNDERIIPRNARGYVCEYMRALEECGEGGAARRAWVRCVCVSTCVVYAHALLLLTRMTMMMMCARLCGYTATVCWGG